MLGNEQTVSLRQPRIMEWRSPCIVPQILGGTIPSIQSKGNNMNWDRIEGNWKQLKGSVKEQWGKLTDDQLDVVGGKRDHLAGKIQETYGISREETEKQITEWQARMKEDIHAS